MAKLKRKNVTPAKSRPPKRARKTTQPFEQGVNPAPPTPPPTASRPVRSPEPSQRSRTPIRSPLFEPEASQLATDAQAAAILGEDDNEVEELEPVDDEDQQVQWALEAATAVEEPAGNSRSVAAVAAAPSRGITEELEELIEPHLHFRWRACWGNMERALIAAACRFARSKPIGGVTEAMVWQWADKTVEEQKPRVAKVDSLTATLYCTNGRQAKADRCTLALQRRRAVAGETLCLGNWDEFRALVEEMDKESSEVLKCDFDLVLRALEEPSSSQLLARTAAAPARSRQGIVTAIQEEGLAEVVAIEHFASGVAIGIKDYWRCNEGGCSNNTMTCWRRPIEGREIDRGEEHYKVNGNNIARWAAEVHEGKCTIQRPSENTRLALMLAKDRSETEKRRKRSKMRGPQHCQQHCQHGVESIEQLARWKDIQCPRLELNQHTFNFFSYWRSSMPQFNLDIDHVLQKTLVDGGYDINMLMDRRDGMTLEVWVEYLDLPPSLLSHFRRKAHDWIKDYGGLSAENYRLINELLSNSPEESTGRTPLGQLVGKAA
ncbi:hypothetical protein EJ07DRAFT_174010 [Lizonia empirigonia]|nr:hypothetical protein EJ07DRAFT_174010 [Lizonia empirigonia]